MIYLRNYLQFEILDQFSNFKEVLIIKMFLDDKNSATLALIYRSPNSDRKYCDELIILIEKLASMDTPNLIIMGDFNFRKINWRELDNGTKDVNSPEDLFRNTVLDNYLIQHIQLRAYKI